MKYLLLLLLASSSALAKSNGKNSAYLNSLEAWSAAEYKPFDPATKFTGRKPQAVKGEASAEYTALVSQVIAAKDSNELQAVIDDVSSKIPAYKDTSSLFLAYQLVALQSVRGALWRLRPLFESNQEGNAFVHSMTVSFLKSVAGQMALGNPSYPPAAMLDYLAAPYVTDGKLVSEIKTVAQLQNWMRTVLRPAIVTLANRMSSLPADTSVIWSQKLAFGEKSFADGAGRDLVLGREEIQAYIALQEINVAQINMFCAYNQNKILLISKDIGRLYGFDGFLFSNIDGVTNADVTRLYGDPRYADLWTLIKEKNIGPLAMKEAYVFLKSAVNRLAAAWAGLKERPDKSGFSLPGLVTRIDTAGSDAYISNLKRLVEGKSVRSMITGETAQVNMAKFFNDPPADLKAFNPTQFDTQKERKISLTLTAGAKEVPYRNFLHGRALGWNVAEYQKYFKVSDDAQIARSLRVFNHTFAGWAVR